MEKFCWLQRWRRTAASASLQGDDLAQLLSRAAQPRTVRGRFMAMYPNVVRLARRYRRMEPRADTIPADAIRQRWRAEAESFLRKASPQERERYEGIPQEIRDAFRTGNLNPPLVIGAVREPSTYARILSPDGEETERGVAHMARHLAAIRETAERHGAETLVVPVPNSFYMSRAEMERARDLGREVNEAMLCPGVGDWPIREAAERAGVPFRTVSEPFRAATARDVLYFPMDGHFTPQGNRVYAGLLAPLVAERLRRR